MPTVPVIVSHTLVADSTNRSNPSYTLPATINPLDLILIFVGCGTNATISAGPAGFTQLETKTVTTINFMECWAKVCDGTEDGATVTFTSVNARAWIADIFRITGGPSSLASLVHASMTATSGSAPASVSVDTITVNNLIIQTLRSGNTASVPMTAPSGWTKQDEGINTGGTGPGSMTSASKTQVAAGATGTDAWTSSASTSYIRITVAVPDGSADAAPTAITGGDQVAAPGATVTLSGSGTDPDGTIAGYSWSCIRVYGAGASTGDPVLSSSTAQNPAFTVPDHDGCVYVFSLVVTDDKGAPSINTALAGVIVDAAQSAGVFPRVLTTPRTRGPDGTRIPPATPPYGTPATVTGITSAAALQTALNACTGGEVLEVTANLTGAVSPASVPALVTSTMNVLVRPPLGERRSISYMLNNCPHVTYAGFDWVDGLHTTVAVTTQASRSGFWRWTENIDSNNLPGTGTLATPITLTTPLSTDVVDQFLVECVQPKWVFNQAYFAHVTASNAVNRRSLIDGCYFGPKIVGIMPNAVLAPGMVNPGCPIDYHGTGPLSVTSGIPITTITSNIDYVSAPADCGLLIWLDEEATGQPVAVTIKINGVVWQTMTLDQYEGYRAGKWQENPDGGAGPGPAGLARSWTVGEVVTADITQVGTGAPGSGLHIMVGVDMEAGIAGGPVGPDYHPHGIQYFSSVGFIEDGVIRDSVIADIHGINLQIESARGDTIYENLFLGGRVPTPGASFGTGGHNFGGTASGGSNFREYCANCDFQVFVSCTQTRNTPLFLNNTCPQFASDHTLDPSNVVVTNPPVPPCPDLVAAWPECPYVVA